MCRKSSLGTFLKSNATQLLLTPLLFSSNAITRAAAAINSTTIPSPIVIPASQDWDGADGPWSSFILQIGTPPQNIKVFLSTASIQTWAVAPEGCITGVDPSDCTSTRGRIYNLNSSSTWRPNLANTSTQIYNLGLESHLGYQGVGRYGFDTIQLGFDGNGGPNLDNQTVASISTTDFWLGFFGVNPRPSNFTNFNDPVSSFMENLKSKDLIPSLSWAYTAGNQYQPIPIFLDSTVPYLYLPLSACALFETAFNLTYDNATELYLLSPTQHASLLAKNASITFEIGNLTSSEKIEIVFPYAAFDLAVTYPHVSNVTKYFPLKRATETKQYTLGRTFFQEAYVVADYERRNFSVSQCKWDLLAPSAVIPILPPTNETSSTDATSEGSKKLPLGAIIGIAIGGAAIASAILAALYVRRRRRRKAAAAKASTHEDTILKPELDGYEALPKTYDTGLEVSDHKHFRPPALEMDGEPHEVHELPAEEVAAELLERFSFDEGSEVVTVRSPVSGTVVSGKREEGGWGQAGDRGGQEPG
ncbi:aspartic peptidase domain-containing protein [Bisporella sp. PMI_857]|nr:aspartic peptidase domain-containing protein [Bisporella sp. PMI_857]